LILHRTSHFEGRKITSN